MTIPKLPIWCVACNHELEELRKIRQQPCANCNWGEFIDARGALYVFPEKRQLTRSDKRFLKSLGIIW